MTTENHVFDTPDDLVEAVARRLLDTLADIQDRGRVPQLCLTGGRLAGQLYTRLAPLAADHRLDWRSLDLWWGDERFVATDSPDRNALALLSSLAKSVPLTPSRIHVMPAAGLHTTVDQAAAEYAAELGSTTFDVCLLGMGPDGHIASLFPNHPSSAATSATVIPVRQSPKPPPERISLTLPVLNASTEVWLLVSGAEKAEAVAAAQAGVNLPASRVHGTAATRWMLDREAAGGLDQ